MHSGSGRSRRSPRASPAVAVLASPPSPAFERQKARLSSPLRKEASGAPAGAPEGSADCGKSSIS